MKRMLVIFSALGLAVLAADGQIVIRNQGYVPFSDAPIRYRSQDLKDPVALLEGKLERGEAKLEYEPGHGYLRSVLEALGIPISSQTLVFSKTSFQFQKISPERPRALYFNDDVYVGQVHDGHSIEFVSFDPMQGAIFYMLNEHRVEHPVFERAELDCVQCHVAASTKGVPGVMLRSVVTGPSGTQVGGTPSYITGHESPIKDRWGGWYVTGAPPNLMHMADLVTAPTGAERVDTRFDRSAYLTDASDIVAHLVLAHQTQMHNLITQTNYQTRLAVYKEGGNLSDAGRQQIERPAEQLVRYLLFADEARLDVPVRGRSRFAEEFARKGPRDPRGRSIRDFDLNTRIFRYPCSYLIYSEAFDAIPEPAKSYIYRRLFDVLTGREQGPVFASLSVEDRRAILEILVATKPGLPDEWKQLAKQREEKK